MPVPSGTMAQIFKDVQVSEAAVTPSAPAPEVSSSESSSYQSQETSGHSTEVQASGSEGAPPSSSQAAPADRTPQRVSWTKYERLMQENQMAMANLESMQQRMAEMESQLARQVVQADPQASAPKPNESQSDWLQRMLDEGEEVNPKLVEQIRSLENKLEQMNQSVQMHNQRWQGVETAQANVAYDENFSKLQNFCPKWDEVRLTTMLAEGVKPRMIVAMYRDVYGDVQSQSAPAQAAQVQRAAPPRIDGPASAVPNMNNEPVTKGNYLQWVREQFNTRH